MSVGRCWGVLECTEECQAMLGSTGQCWEVPGSAEAGKCLAVLGIARQSLAVLGSSGEFKAVQGSAEFIKEELRSVVNY